MKKHLPYWIITILAGLGLLASGGANVAGAPEVVATITGLGYPAYFPQLLGVFKILGGIAILVPLFPGIKEWAYAGATFLFIGAFSSHVIYGDPFAQAVPPLIPLVFVLASYYFFRKKRAEEAAV